VDHPARLPKSRRAGARQASRNHRYIDRCTVVYLPSPQAASVPHKNAGARLGRAPAEWENCRGLGPIGNRLTIGYRQTLEGRRAQGRLAADGRAARLVALLDLAH
jgi:hypothetical protein